MSVEAVPPAADPEDPVAALASRLAQQIGHMRDNAQFAVEQWLLAAERGMGGRLVLDAPSKVHKLTNPEAHYATEGYTQLRLL